MHTLQAALVGTGFIGPVHLEALRRLGIPVVGVLGSSLTRSQQAARQFHLPKAYASYAELLADPAVQVVHLTSPNALHFEQCRQALLANKHVICEKPLALTPSETAELVRLARATPVVAAVCYNVRFYPLCLEARERVRSGSLGRIYHITGSYVQDWLLYETDFNWRVQTESGGALRAVADIGTHWLDLLQTITGLKVVEVCADLRTFLPTRRQPKGSTETFQNKLVGPTETEAVSIATEDYGSILLRWEHGAAGVLTVSQVCAGRKNALRFEIAGSQAALAWDSEQPNELWLGHRERANEVLMRDPALLHENVRPYANYPGGHAEGFPDTFKQLFRAIYSYIAHGDFTLPRPFPTFEAGHHEVQLCDAILRSQQSRQWVSILG